MESTSRKRAKVSVVIYSSVVLTWCFEEKASPQTDALFERVRDRGAVVPALWHLELANLLLQADKRRRIAAADVVTRLELIAELPIATDPETAVRAWREVIALARAERLTACDAAYLELAVRRGLPLSTRDDALISAAGRVGVAIIA